jgi:serine/threonine protein kinase
VARCLGYIKIPQTDDATRFGIVFEEPLIHGAESKIVTLQDLLERQPHPSLSARLALCAVLARCVHSFHAVNWLHKALQPDNIIFFSSSELPSLNEPFLSGFELSRPSIMDQLTEKPRFDPLQDIYRHPNAQSSQADGKYRKSYDIYSLGVLMIQVALWKRIEDVVPLKDLAKAKPPALREIHPWLLGMPSGTGSLSNITGSESCLQQVAFACGDSFRDIVEQCLRMDTVESPEYFGRKKRRLL